MTKLEQISACIQLAMGLTATVAIVFLFLSMLLRKNWWAALAWFLALPNALMFGLAVAVIGSHYRYGFLASAEALEVAFRSVVWALIVLLITWFLSKFRAKV